MRRASSLRIPVTDEEHAAFTRLAGEAGLGVAEFVRRTVLGVEAAPAKRGRPASIEVPPGATYEFGGQVWRVERQLGGGLAAVEVTAAPQYRAESLVGYTRTGLRIIGEGAHRCASPRCPGYPWRASDQRHPPETCGPDLEEPVPGVGADLRRIGAGLP